MRGAIRYRLEAVFGKGRFFLVVVVDCNPVRLVEDTVAAGIVDYRQEHKLQTQQPGGMRCTFHVGKCILSRRSGCVKLGGFR